MVNEGRIQFRQNNTLFMIFGQCEYYLFQYGQSLLYGERDSSFEDCFQGLLTIILSYHGQIILIFEGIPSPD